MKFRHDNQRNCLGGPWRHVWSITGRSWAVGFALLVERTPSRPLRLVKLLRVPTTGSYVLWIWRFGFGLRLRALTTWLNIP